MSTVVREGKTAAETVRENSPKELFEDIYRLSPVQEGLLFHTLYAPRSGVYVQQVVAGLRGDLAGGPFKEAWQAVVDRQPILRTFFLWERRKKPLQVVQRKVGLAWEEEDWRELSPQRQQEKLDRFLERDRKRGFELSKAPLMRFALFRLDDEKYRFVWSFHHLILDGWSMSLVIREMSEHFRALRRRSAAALEPVVPFRRYISWLGKLDADRVREFWRRKMKGIGAPTPLGIGEARGKDDAEPSYEEKVVRLPEETTSLLTAVTRSRQLTLNTVIQGCWALLVSRYSGQGDVVFGTTVAGRPDAIARVEALIGVFINTLPVRVAVSRDMSFADWLRLLQDQQSEMRQYEHSPLVKIHQWSDVPQDLPLFESLLIFHNFPAVDELLEPDDGLTVEDLRFVARSNYPLTVVSAPGERLWIRIAYDRRRFTEAAVDRMLGHLQSLLEGFATRPDQRVGDVAILTSNEERELKSRSRGRRVPHRATAIHALIEARAVERPTARAVSCGEASISYGELDRRANQWARELRRRGVGSESRVGIAMDRSLDLVVGILGILKAGAAYVPLDPAYPEQRLAYIVENARMELLVTRQDVLERLPAQRPPTLLLDVDEGRLSVHGEDGLDVPIHSAQAAYLIYTSGSTGRPKGVMVTHANLSRYVQALREPLGVSRESVYLHTASFAFSSSVRQLMVPLANGAQITLARPEEIADPLALLELIQRHNVTVIDLVPSYWRQLTEALKGLDSTMRDTLLRNRLECLLSASEPLLSDVPRHWRRAFGHPARFVNMFGQTETTGIVSTFPIREDQGERVEVVAIGRPIDNTRVYLMDPTMQLAPEGVAGEVCIGGQGLARGYFGPSSQTAVRFVPDASSDEPGARLYRTGDLARRRAEGDVEFLGRSDHQIKVRGFRIEPKEIEGALCEHEEIREAVAVALEETPGDRRLVAYVTTAAERPPSPDELRRVIERRLPSYMVPSTFVVLDDLPRTPTGKVNRSALPAPGQERPEIAEDYVAPRTPIEQELAQIWATILGIGEVGIHDSFASLGGHSLMATQIISRVRDAFEVDLPLRSLFENPSTVAGMAQRIESLKESGEASTKPPLVRVPRDGRIPLSFAQQRMWVLYRLDSGNAFYNIPNAFRMHGPLDATALEKSLRGVVARHEVLRTTLAEYEGEGVQRILDDFDFRLARVDLTELPSGEREEKARNLARSLAWTPFDLTRDILLRATLMKLDDQDHVLLLVTHHIAFDGWSNGVFVREIRQLYLALCDDRVPELPELPIQYADFAVWQRQWLRGEVLRKHLDFWRTKLAGAPSGLYLPTARMRPAEQTYRGDRERFALDVETTRALKALVERRGVTLYTLLLAAFKTLLFRYSSETDIVVGTPIANRTQTEFEPMVGFFANTLVLRSDLAGDPDFLELVDRLQEETLEAAEHQDLPFDQLVKELRPERHLGRNPLFQIMFNTQNTPVEEAPPSDLTVEAFPFDVTATHFDISFYTWEMQGVLRGQIFYSSDLFDAETIRRMLDHYSNLLSNIVEAPATPISKLRLMDDAERRRILELASPERPAERRARLSGAHQLFERRVEVSPRSTALVCGERSSTYVELNAHANQIAHRLLRLGVTPGTLVGLCLERSASLVAGILGILKAGGTYVPVDPGYPRARQDLILEEAGVEALVTRGSLRQSMPTNDLLLLDLDADESAIRAEPSENPDVVVDRDSPAYVMFTSGSTGTPKGAMISHGNLCHYVPALQEHLEIGPDDVYLHTASFAFAASGRQMWLPLSQGARMIIALPEQMGNPIELFERIRDLGVTVLDIVPSYWQNAIEILDGLAPQERKSILANDVRYVFTASEALLADTVEHWRRQLEQPSVTVNLYGQTETTGTVSHFFVTEPLGDRVVVPIGRPVTGTPIFLLDPRLQLAPLGVAGEIHVGGPALARGYLGRPALTAATFIPDPFSGGSGARLYRTGDMARYAPDGSLDYLGRRDSQVKVHGFRVELSEVEATLARNPDVRQNVVIARQTAPGQSRLIAYVVPRSEAAALSVEGLRDFLRAQLPDYMVPSLFVALDALPRTPTGKLDRRALPEPDHHRPDLEQPFVAARTSVERRLARIWRDTLGLDSVGVHDNFFALGGDSVLGIQFAARANNAGFDFDLRTLLRHQTIAELAVAAGRKRRIHAEQGILSGPLELTPAQHMYFERGSEELHHHNQSFLLELNGEVRLPILEASVRHLLLQHDGLRQRFEYDDGEWKAWMDEPTETAPIALIDLSALPESVLPAALDRALNALQQSLDLRSGPIVRFTLFDLGRGEPIRLQVIVHHLAVDATSWRVLLEDFRTAWQQLLRGRKVRLPAKTTSLRHWTSRLSEHARSDELLDELDYWLDEARDRVAPLPLDKPDGDDSWSSNRFVLSSLEADATRALLQELPGLYRVGVEDVLVTALSRALRRWSAAETLLIDLANHGRIELFDDVDLSRTVGWCTSTAPVLVEVPPDEDVIGGVLSVQRQLEGVPREGIGYRLLRFFRKDPALLERLKGRPQPQIHVSYWGQFDPLLMESSTFFRPAREHPGADTSPLFERPFVFTLYAALVEGQLQLRFGYGRNRHERSTAEGLVAACLDEMRSIVDQARSTKQPTAGSEKKTMPTTKPKSQPASASAKPYKKAKRVEVKTEPLTPGSALPLLVHPIEPGHRLLDYVKKNRRPLEFQLLQHSGILFRGFDVGDVGSFEEVIAAVSGELLDYTYRSTPRSHVKGNIFTSTEYPPDKSIPMHNEMSYTRSWPLKIWFYSVDAADSGGETPIADSRNVLQRIDPEIRERFDEAGVMYVRNYGSALDLAWQDVFQTDDKSAVEAMCAERGIEFEWIDADELRTRQTCQATAAHPVTGDEVWFNQAHLFHISNSAPEVRKMLVKEYGEERLPRNAYYGDGTPIEDAVLDHIREAYREEMVLFPWQVGDVLLLDNMLVAHGRQPFEGTRKVVVGMAEGCSDD